MTLDTYQYIGIPGDTVRRGWSAQPFVRSPDTDRRLTNGLLDHTAWLDPPHAAGRDFTSEPRRAAPRRWLRLGLSVTALALGAQLDHAERASAQRVTIPCLACVPGLAAIPPPAPSVVSVMNVQTVLPGGNLNHGWLNVALQWMNYARHNGGFLVERSNCGYCDGTYVPATWTVVRPLARTYRAGMMQYSDRFLNTPSRAGACYRVVIFNVARSAIAYSPIVFQQSCVSPASPQ
jgi:hypothetical protein